MNRLFEGNSAMALQSRAIYLLIRQQEYATRQFLATRLPYPATTLNRALERLLASGLIEESGLAESSGGRRPSLFHTNAGAFCLVGLDLSGPDGRLVLTDLHLRVLSSCELPAWHDHQNASLIAAILDFCQDQTGKNDFLPARALGLGICREAGPGAAASADSRTAGLAAELEPVLAAQMSLPVMITDAADAEAAVVKWADPAGFQAETGRVMLGLSIGDDIRLSLTQWGPSRQPYSLTPDLSRLLVPSPEKASGSGVPLGKLAPVPGLVARYQKLKSDNSLTWLDFCQAVRSGKHKATLIMQEAAQALAVALLNVSAVTCGQAFMIGGPALADLPELEEALKNQVEEMAAKTGWPVRIVANPFGAASRAVGAAAAVLDRAVQED